MNISIGFSPCPNDTFIFDALVNNKIDTGDIQFNPMLDDVQTLNQWAIEGKLDVTKLSFAVLPLVFNNYQVLNSGSALGKGVGPLLVVKDGLEVSNVEDHLIAIPGKNTTAHLLFSLKYPAARKKTFVRYDEIEEFVLQGKGLGVIIHENRFTYEEKGIKKIIDLGDFWEQEIKVPIPLGGIVVKRTIDIKLQQRIDSLISKSIEYAYKSYPELSKYVRQHSQEMSEDIMRKHIDLYVNRFSKSLGYEGKTAVLKLLEVYSEMNEITFDSTEIFVG